MKSKEVEQNSKTSNTKTMPSESGLQLHRNVHAQTYVATNKSAVQLQNQRSTTPGNRTVIIRNFYLPIQISKVRDELLVQKSVNEKVEKYENEKEWFQGKLIKQHKFGYCKYYLKKQYYYEGQFSCSLKHGKGLIIYENGDYYQGEFFADKILGDNGMFKEFEDECKLNTKLEKKKLEFSNGAIYQGQVLDGKRHGKGVYTWKDGTKYEGQFQNDQFNGYGVMEFADSSKFKGEWVNGEMEGFGHYIWPNSEEYKGYYKKSKKNGFGVFKYKSGVVYFGDFLDGLNHGDAVLKQLNSKPKISKWQDELPFKNLTQFEKEFKNALKEIQSTDSTLETQAENKNSLNSVFVQGSTFERIKSSQKSKSFAYFQQKSVEKIMYKRFFNVKEPFEQNSDLIYYGQFHNEKAHGFGKLVSKKTSILFEGHFTFGQIHGSGRLIMNRGDVFEGRWFFNKILSGTYYNELLKPIIQIKELSIEFPQVRSQKNYHGNLINNRREGFGRYQWNDGTYYVGEFVDNTMCGFGRMIYQDGRRYLGYWKNNEMDGYGEFEWPNGQIYIGSYIKDKKHGTGMIILDGRVAIAEFENGKSISKSKDFDLSS
ncbi:unnamed protein product [Paramecium octaurelia]|uniref:Uncharacterized protein n=1 Tax=Paramecium octaurelia TaxID=43137 RepID=A0A8S1YK81_PAROT|nr:unnamed protein product [Paramecium octaurelia]